MGLGREYLSSISLERGGHREVEVCLWEAFQATVQDGGEVNCLMCCNMNMDKSVVLIVEVESRGGGEGV